MTWWEFGSIFLFLLVLVILGNIWFHFVESLLEKIRNFFCRSKEPPRWHELPQEEMQEEKEDI